MTRSETARRAAARVPRLHAVTDDAVLSATAWTARAAAVLEAGGPDLALHVRGPRTDPRTLLGLVEDLLEPARRSGALLLVNDRVDVVMVSKADGVHLGRRSLPAARARDILGADALVGVSCHELQDVPAAAADGADFAFLGTIFPTASHPAASAKGPEGLEKVVGVGSAIPVIGIGGVGPAETKVLVATGAHGVAAIRGIWHATDPAEAVRQYLEGLSEEGAEL